MLLLTTLGGIDLRDHEGREVRALLSQPKRFALLVYLALTGADRFVQRDTLLSLFWPELDQEHARAALRQALSFLRRTLGADCVVSRGDGEIAIAGDILECDAVRFAESNRAPADAMGHYRGDFLDGFYIADASAEFDEWVARTRDSLRRSAGTLAMALANAALADGESLLAAQWASEAVALIPGDESIVRQSMSVYDALGDRAGALQIYQTFERLVESEFGAKPGAETARLRADVLARTAVRTVAAAAETEAADSNSTAKVAVTARIDRRPVWVVFTVTALVIAILAFRSIPARRHEIGAPATKRTSNIQAESAWVRGQLHMAKRDSGSTRRARLEFSEAIDADPNFAGGYAWLAYAYGAMAHQGSMPAAEAFPLLRRAAEKALELDPTNALATAHLASYHSWYEWNWEAGERGFQSALALGPNDPDVHNLYGIHLRMLGRYTEALAEMERAHTLDPLIPHFNNQVGRVLLCADRPADALTTYRRSIELGVDATVARRGMAAAFAAEQLWDSALVQLWMVGTATHDSLLIRVARPGSGKAGFEAYQRMDASRDLSGLLRAATSRYVEPTLIAEAYAAVHDQPNAIAWLERAFTERDVAITKLGCSSAFDAMLTDSAFRRIAKGVGVGTHAKRRA